MNTVLVTGCAGFVDSHLVRSLLSRGDRVRVLDNFSSGKRENLTGAEGSLEIFEGDLRNPALLQDVTQGVDMIFHLAAFVSVPQSMVEPQLCYDVNVTRAPNLLEAAEKPQAAGLVFSVCSGETVSNIDLAEILSVILSDAPAHQYEPPRAGDKYLSQGSPSRAEQVLGFHAQVSLTDRLAETVERMQT